MLYTIYGNGTYEVIAAFRTHILTEKEDGFRYLSVLLTRKDKIRI